VVEVKLASFAVQSPCRFGDGWAATQLWAGLGRLTFWRAALAEAAGEVPWAKVMERLVVNRLLGPRSELFGHEKGFPRSAMAVLRDPDARVAAKDRRYRCLDRLLPHTSPPSNNTALRSGRTSSARPLSGWSTI